MKDYNGFTGAQRAKAQAWLNAQWRKGPTGGGFARPSECCACGQTGGVIDAHAEDYSEPFTRAKLMRYPLCFICHMMVHCRFRAPAAWAWYREMIGDGLQFKPYAGRNFGQFTSDFLKLRREHAGIIRLPPYVIRPMKPVRRVLDGIKP